MQIRTLALELLSDAGPNRIALIAAEFRTTQLDIVRAKNLAHRHSLTRKGRVIQLIEGEYRTPRQVRNDRFEAFFRWLVYVEIKISERDNGLRIAREIIRHSLGGIAANERIFLDMRDRIFALMVVENLFQIFLISRRHRICCHRRGGCFAVLCVNRGKALESVKADDAASMIERLVNPPQIFIKGEVSSPAHAKLDNDPVDVKYFGV